MSLLSRRGILGMNKRNACYTLIFNPRKRYPLVDDKLITKQLLVANQIPTPELYFAIEGNFELRMLREIKFLKEMVVKPARGAEGRGILVLAGKQGGLWQKANGDLISSEDLEYHVSNILAGLYSLGGTDDRAFIEYRVRSHATFNQLAYQGVPDIRVILYRGVPAMSMLRLPTQESDGKANLHQGAVGAGVDMKTGITKGGVHRNRLIDKHPDTYFPITGMLIPYWEKILEVAVRLYEIFGLGYMGIDFVIDQMLGPLILELNARPGLTIQMANRKGLLEVLDAIDRCGGKTLEKKSWRERMEFFRQVVLPLY